MNEEELKKYIKEKFKEIHTKMLNNHFISTGTLIRFRDACIEFGKQEQKKEFEKNIKLIEKFKGFRLRNTDDVYNEIFMGEMFGIDTALRILSGELEIKENGEVNIDFDKLEKQLEGVKRK